MEESTTTKISSVSKETPDLLDERLDRLKELIPEAFTEREIDFEKLRAALGDLVREGPERYHFTWAGKQDAIRALKTPSRATLAPAREESINFDEAKNVFIEGENLEVLKLLYKSYFGRVKMIYIDPPYNTGNDFIYPDDFSDPLETYLRITGQKDENGDLLTSNPETSGRYHSAWLSMMYPRLFLARQLLRDDGVIFVSIDDNEVYNLRMLMNEIFGEENFVGCVVWERKRKGSHLSEKITQKTEYILIYGRDADRLKLFGEAAGEDEDQPLIKRTNARKELKIPAGIVETQLSDRTFEPGKYGSGSSAVELLEQAQVRDGLFVTPLRLRGPFIWTQSKLDEELEHGARFFIRTDNFSLRALKAPERQGFKALSSLLTKEFGTNESATTEVAELLDLPEEEIPINYPKPSTLITHLVRSATKWDNEALVVDFFAGAGTTAQAVLEVNRELGGNRRFILIQLPQPTMKKLADGSFEETTASLAGYRTIADVCKMRVRRVLMQLPNAERLGFRVFRLTESNFKQWPDTHGDVDVDTYLEQVEAFTDTLRDGWTLEAVIFEVALKEGYSLTSRIEPMDEVEDAAVYRVTDPEKAQHFHICLDDEVRLSTLEPLQLGTDDLFVCRDSALDDDTAANLSLQCRLKTL